MWSLQLHNRFLYGSVLLGICFLVFAALGPGLISNSTLYLNNWQYQVFEILCHQDPARSFTLSGFQMAVCARCLGIYMFLLAGWMLLPVYALLKKRVQITEKHWLIGAILLNLTDIVFNYFGIWTNTLISRFLLGSLIGVFLALLLVREFFTIKKAE